MVVAAALEVAGGCDGSWWQWFWQLPGGGDYHLRIVIMIKNYSSERNKTKQYGHMHF